MTRDEALALVIEAAGMHGESVAEALNLPRAITATDTDEEIEAMIAAEGDTFSVFDLDRALQLRNLWAAILLVAEKDTP